MMTDVAAPARTTILWDIVQEHLDEAEFLYGHWSAAFDSPKYTLGELANTLERRLEAHLDGLVVGGAEVARRLLDQELTNVDEPARATVTALALLATGDAANFEKVITATHTGEKRLREALLQALALSPHSFIDDACLRQLSAASEPSIQESMLHTLTKRGVACPLEALRAILSEEKSCVIAGLQALQQFPSVQSQASLEALAASDDDAIACAAIRAGAVLGLPFAWQRCVSLVEGGSRDCELWTLIALLGRPEHHSLLHPHLENAALRERALWTLGICGTPQSGDQCRRFLSDANPRARKAAAASLAWIGGFDLFAKELQCEESEPSEEQTLPPLKEEDLERDLGIDGLDELPLPNAIALSAMWERARSKMNAGYRYGAGQILTGGGVLRALRTAPLWHRDALALETTLRSGGRNVVNVRSFSRQQKKQLDRLGDSAF